MGHGFASHACLHVLPGLDFRDQLGFTVSFDFPGQRVNVRIDRPLLLKQSTRQDIRVFVLNEAIGGRRLQENEDH